MYPETDTIKSLVQHAQHIVVVQADNPDMDSMGSSLALEQLLGEQGKEVTLYCSVDMPGYLRYMQGWDRIVTELPRQFDLSVIVDASTYTLLSNMDKAGELSWLKAKPAIALDHHASVQNQLDFLKAAVYDEHASSTGEIIFNLAAQLGWALDKVSGENIMSAILADTQGLANDLATPATYRAMAQIVELGVDRQSLEEKRRAFSKMPPAIYRYKAKLIERTELLSGGSIAVVTVPQNEINDYSPLYNPVALIQFDMLQISGVQVAVVFKIYDDGHVTAAIRANHGYGIAAQLAEALGGGGHPYAAGFKVVNGRPFNEIKSECTELATRLLTKLEEEHTHAALQHTDA